MCGVDQLTKLDFGYLYPNYYLIVPRALHLFTRCRENFHLKIPGPNVLFQLALQQSSLYLCDLFSLVGEQRELDNYTSIESLTAD